MSTAQNGIFNNKIEKKVLIRAAGQKKKYVKKFGDPALDSFELGIEDNDIIGSMIGVKNLVNKKDALKTDYNKSIVVGNIRMGFGHYRIAMALASCANYMGYTPLWFDIPSFENTTGGKIVTHLNKLYSLGSKLSQKNALFNKYYWEPLNYEGFKKLSYNAVDQEITTLMSPLCSCFPKDLPFIATHVWPAQAAVHAGMKNVINMIPDNWPMALHLAEGAVHTVQSFSSYLGYRSLREMQGKHKMLTPIPSGQIYNTGHYVDHEIVSNLESDCAARLNRLNNNSSKRILLSVGGAGAQKEIFCDLINFLIPYIKSKKVTLFINVGDHISVWDSLKSRIPDLEKIVSAHFNDWSEECSFADSSLSGDAEGIHVFYNENIYSAVYITNLLMRASDLLITKPSELSFYPVPKLFIKRVGGHEQWGAIRSAEIGDGSFECETTEMTVSVLKLLLENNEILENMIENILIMNKNKIYNGAYEVLKLSLKDVL